MKAVIDQSLGNIQCVHAFARLALVGENHFVHRRAVERLFVIRYQTVGNVTRVEHGSFRSLAQSVASMRENVSQRAQHHSIISEECFYSSDGLWIVEVESVSSTITADYSRNWQKRLKFFGTATRPATWPTAAMRG